MNIYARYFDQDILVHNVDELIDFLSNIPDINVTPQLVEDVTNYIKSDVPYPRRYKVRPRVYFILIKTTAANMVEFKAHRKTTATGDKQLPATAIRPEEPMNRKEFKAAQLQEERDGWYKGVVQFKRVIQIPNTSKFRYQDTSFSAFVRAVSGQDCYNRIIDYLKKRSDIDLRSQFPSPKGQNYNYNFIGTKLPAGAVKAARESVEK